MEDPDYTSSTLIAPDTNVLKKILLQEGLVDKKATLTLLESFSEDVSLSDIYYGTGISNPNELTIGIPIDFLIYPLIANKIRNGLNVGGHIHHLIADNHALLNKFDAKLVKKVASDYRKRVEDIVDKIGIKDYHIYLSSEIATDKSYKLLLEKVPDSTCINSYAKLEAADVEYFFKTRDVVLKLGWKFSGNSAFDEQSFDNEYKKVFGNNVVPIYTACGKRFSDMRPNTVPYTIYKDEVDIRLILSENEDVLKKVASQTCSKQTLNMLQNHYKAIVRLFEEATQKSFSSFKTTWEKINYINQFLTA